MASTTFTVTKGREYLLKRCAFMGLDVFLKDGRKTLPYYLSLRIPISYQVCCLYSFYLLQNDTLMILQCLSMWGAAGQCTIKTWLAYYNRKGFREAFYFIKCQQEESNDDLEIYNAFWKTNRKHYFYMRLLVYVLNMNVVMMASYPLLNFLVYGRRKFVLICNIPGLNPDPEAGFPDYEIQTAIHLGCLFVGVNGVVAFDGIFAYFVLNGASLAEALIIHIRRMSSHLTSESITDAGTTEYIRHLSKLHQKYIDYVKLLDRMYNLMFLMQYGSYALSGSVGLYAARISDWYAVYWLVLSTIFQLFCSCFLGTIIESKNSEIADELYKTQWTEMSVKNRRMMLFMMHRAKTQRSITVGNVLKLNLETGMKIYKILYSYFVLLMDAVKV